MVRGKGGVERRLPSLEKKKGHREEAAFARSGKSRSEPPGRPIKREKEVAQIAFRKDAREKVLSLIAVEKWK